MFKKKKKQNFNSITNNKIIFRVIKNVKTTTIKSVVLHDCEIKIELISPA